METEIRVKPILFESACLFSFLGSTIGLLYMSSFALFFDDMNKAMGKFTSYASLEGLTPLYFAALMVGYTVSLTGVIKIYRLQRSGLYFYLTAQMMILVLPIIWRGLDTLSVTNIIFTLIFPGIYVYYYRLLN